MPSVMFCKVFESLRRPGDDCEPEFEDLQLELHPNRTILGLLWTYDTPDSTMRSPRAQLPSTLLKTTHGTKRCLLI